MTTSTTAMLNIESTTLYAHRLIYNLDKTLIGTVHYLGIAWFWDHDYRHYLRGVSYARRRQVHHALLKAGLRVDRTSTEHEDIIKDIATRKRTSRKSIPF